MTYLINCGIIYTIKPDFSKFRGDFDDFSGDSGDFSKSSDPFLGPISAPFPMQKNIFYSQLMRKISQFGNFEK